MRNSTRDGYEKKKKTAHNGWIIEDEKGVSLFSSYRFHLYGMWEARDRRKGVVFDVSAFPDTLALINMFPTQFGNHNISSTDYAQNQHNIRYNNDEYIWNHPPHEY